MSGTEILIVREPDAKLFCYDSAKKMPGTNPDEALSGAGCRAGSTPRWSASGGEAHEEGNVQTTRLHRYVPRLYALSIQGVVASGKY